MVRQAQSEAVLLEPLVQAVDEPDDECRARQRSKVKEEPSEGRGTEMADCLGGNGHGGER